MDSGSDTADTHLVVSGNVQDSDLDRDVRGRVVELQVAGVVGDAGRERHHIQMAAEQLQVVSTGAQRIREDDGLTALELNAGGEEVHLVAGGSSDRRHRPGRSTRRRRCRGPRDRS